MPLRSQPALLLRRRPRPRLESGWLLLQVGNAGRAHQRPAVCSQPTVLTRHGTRPSERSVRSTITWRSTGPSTAPGASAAGGHPVGPSNRHAGGTSSTPPSP